jgi:hypothetical protein
MLRLLCLARLRSAGLRYALLGFACSALLGCAALCLASLSLLC